MSSTNPNYSESSWCRCPAGELRALSRRLKRHRQARLIFVAAGASTSLLVAVSMGTWLLGTAPRRAVQRPITCRDVHDYAPQYLAGTLAHDLQERVSGHLVRCAKCRDWIEAQRHVSRIAPDAHTGRGTTAPRLVAKQGSVAIGPSQLTGLR